MTRRLPDLWQLGGSRVYGDLEVPELRTASRVLGLMAARGFPSLGQLEDSRVCGDSGVPGFMAARGFLSLWKHWVVKVLTITFLSPSDSTVHGLGELPSSLLPSDRVRPSRLATLMGEVSIMSSPARQSGRIGILFPTARAESPSPSNL